MSFDVPGTIFVPSSSSLRHNFVRKFLLVRKYVVRENNFDCRVAEVDPFRVKAGKMLDWKSAFRGQDAGHKEVLDGDERRNKRHFEKARCHRFRENVAENVVKIIRQVIEFI